MSTVSIIYFSGSGHNTKLAEAVQKGAASVAGVQTHLIAINGKDITEGRYKNDDVFAKLDASDARRDHRSKWWIGLFNEPCKAR